MGGSQTFGLNEDLRVRNNALGLPRHQLAGETDHDRDPRAAGRAHGLEHVREQ